MNTAGKCGQPAEKETGFIAGVNMLCLVENLRSNGCNDEARAAKYEQPLQSLTAADF